MTHALDDRDQHTGGFVVRPGLDRYAPRYAEHFDIRRNEGVIEVRMHTRSGPAVFSRGLLNAWSGVLSDIAGDRDNEVLIITGTGGHWIKGIDPRSFAQPLSQWHSDAVYEQYRDGARLVESLVCDIDIPTIGAINGPGPRQELALLCDVTLIAENGEIGDQNFMAGSVPGDGMHLVLRELIGTKRAAYCAYTGDRIDALTAAKWGLVNEVHAADRLLPRAREIAAAIMARPRTSRRLTRDVVRNDWQRRIVAELRGGYAQQLLASRLA